MSRRQPIPVIDLFAGPGGLGEGFCSLDREAGDRRFRIRLSIEKDPVAHRTLLLRSFYRQFEPLEVPHAYYQRLRGEIRTEDLFKLYPVQAHAAVAETWRAELGSRETPLEQLRDRVGSALSDTEHWVLIGGPPCQAYSLAGRSRNKGREGYRFEDDPKTRLYLEYLQIIADFWPSVFVMENVKGLLSATLDGQRLFNKIAADLADPAAAIERNGRGRRRARKYNYTLHALAPAQNETALFDRIAPADFVVRCEDMGIPQARHRVIVVGVRDDIESSAFPPLRFSPAPSVEAMIDDLPALRSGLSKEDDSPKAWVDAVLETCSTASLRRLRAEISKTVVDSMAALASRRSRMLRLDRGAEFINGAPCVQYKREWFVDPRIGGFCNHSTRAHIKADLHRYIFAAAYAQSEGSSPELSEFPRFLLPLHENVDVALEGSNFSDRFRVQVRSRHSTTITCHISKDGHYYIHYDPIQCRSLTVREAARLQTFPDNYFFEGFRTSQYIQVGNAVPPLLARQIAQSVISLFG